MSLNKYQSKIDILSSSHGLKFRHLPYYVKRAFRRQGFKFRPKVIGRSGLKISDSIVDEFTSKAISHYPNPYILFVLLGDNNMRPNRKNAEHCFETLEFFERLIKNFSNFSHCKLVIGSIIPSPLTDEVSKAIFKTTNNILNSMIKEEENRVSFMNITNMFVFQGKVRREFFRRDKIHFNNRGTKLVAKWIFEHIRKLPSKLN